jgi:hypothetical protein
VIVNPLSKWPYGTTLQQERQSKRKATKAQTDAVRRDVYRRDRYRCRIPGCKEDHIELVHLDPKGMGGDHGIRTTTQNAIAGCRDHHTGPRSIHSGEIEVIPLTSAGADGPLAFHWRSEGKTVKEK